MPRAVDRVVFQGELDALRVREKAHTREGDAIAAARRRLPMVEVAADLPLVGPNGTVTLLDAFEGRTQLIAYYFMWHPGHPAPDQCEGCTWCNTHVAELAYVQARDITYAVLCQGPYEESARYRDFMGWTMPWYSALPSLDTLLVGRTVGMMHIVCYVRDDDRIFETYWTTLRGVEAMDNSYGLMDLTVYGRQEAWEDSPPGWPQPWGAGAARIRTDGRPIAQWSRIEAGRSDDLAAEH
ncbi:MAG: hypothetical protein QOE20_3698 [Mycobacterium sp.]|nr:hypothetical protein [Mycobacterium sp.]